MSHSIKESKKLGIEKQTTHYVLKAIVPKSSQGSAQAKIQSYKCQTKESIEDENQPKAGKSSI